MIPTSQGETLRVAETRPAFHIIATSVSCWAYIPDIPSVKVRSIIMRWNGQWIGGDRFARDYATGIKSFTADVMHAVVRFHPAKHFPKALELQTHAAVWAAALMAFEAASFREPDREALLAALLRELRTQWRQDESSSANHEAAILERAMDYFALRNCGSQLKTAKRIVNSYLLAVGAPEPIAYSSALARHLAVDFGYRILRDIYRLSAASRLRTAAVSMVERRTAARI
jgi:hypothetical protein